MRIADSLFYIHISSHTPYKILNRSNIDDRWTKRQMPFISCLRFLMLLTALWQTWKDAVTENISWFGLQVWRWKFSSRHSIDCWCNTCLRSWSCNEEPNQRFQCSTGVHCQYACNEHQFPPARITSGYLPRPLELSYTLSSCVQQPCEKSSRWVSAKGIIILLLKFVYTVIQLTLCRLFLFVCH